MLQFQRPTQPRTQFPIARQTVYAIRLRLVCGSNERKIKENNILQQSIDLVIPL